MMKTGFAVDMMNLLSAENMRGFENPLFKRAYVVSDRLGKKSAMWKRVHEILSRPRKQLPRVNLAKLKHARDGEKIVVPGFLLGGGEVEKPVEVYCLWASARAKEKIEKAGGKVIYIHEATEVKGPWRIIA